MVDPKNLVGFPVYKIELLAYILRRIIRIRRLKTREKSKEIRQRILVPQCPSQRTAIFFLLQHCRHVHREEEKRVSNLTSRMIVPLRRLHNKGGPTFKRSTVLKENGIESSSNFLFWVEVEFWKEKNGINLGYDPNKYYF